MGSQRKSRISGTRSRSTSCTTTSAASTKPSASPRQWKLESRIMFGQSAKSSGCSTRKSSGQRNPLTPNHLLIDIPNVAYSYGEILLNGKPLRHLLSLTIEVPGRGKCNTFTTVTAKFLSSVRLEGDMRAVRVYRRKLEFTS